MAFGNLLGRTLNDDELRNRRIEPRMEPEPGAERSEVFDSGRKTIIDCAHVKVERLDTQPVLFSKVFKEFQDRQGQIYDYRYWAERENFILREFLKKQSEFTHVVQARHLISENEAAKQVLTCDAGITIANWLRVKSRYDASATLSHPFQQWDACLRLIRACLVALKQIHEHRIVHCDIKEDNICIPYAPQPYRGGGQKIRLEFGKLKLIDFAFSIAHSIPLTQILIINPDEPLPYQSQLLISALRVDRASGSPNAVQQLDCRVDLFSLGAMAEKICAAGLVGPRGADDERTSGEIRRIVADLKASESVPLDGPLPHDGLIARIDALLADCVDQTGAQEFSVDGEWTTAEMEQGRGAGRKTPLTPVALPVPTPVALPVAKVSRADAGMGKFGTTLIVLLALALAAGGFFLVRETMNGLPQADAPAKKSAQGPGEDAAAQKGAQEIAAKSMARVASQLRDDEDLVFQAASGDLGHLVESGAPGAKELAAAIAAEYGGVLNSTAAAASRQRALTRLNWMAATGNTIAATQVSAFEKSYDDVKQQVAKSPWWLHGQGEQPAEAARWIENGALLSALGDRPAMLDSAYALGHGRGVPQDRAKSVETYLQVVERSGGSDETSGKIRGAATRGLGAMLRLIAENRDHDAAIRVFPVLTARAERGAKDLQYYLGLMSECALQPASLEAARNWYRRAAAEPGWKDAAVRRARSLGKSCPRPAG